MKNLIFLAVAAFWAVPARAGLKAGDRIASAGVGGGGSATVTDWREFGGPKEGDYKGGSAFDVQYLYQLTPNVGLGGELEFTSYGHRDHTLTSYSVRTGGEALTAELFARYTFRAAKLLRPYLLAGFGLASQHVYALTTPRPGVTWAGGTRESRTNYDTTLTGVASSLGLGVEGDLNERFIMGLDLRLRTRGADKTVADSALGGTRDFSDNGGASLLLRMAYRF